MQWWVEHPQNGDRQTVKLSMEELETVNDFLVPGDIGERKCADRASQLWEIGINVVAFCIIERFM